MIPEPEPLDDISEEPWHRFYFRAWRVLRFDRQYGALGGESPISFMAISEYGRRYRIEGEDFDLLLDMVAALDREWLDFVAEQQEKAKAK